MSIRRKTRRTPSQSPSDRQGKKKCSNGLSHTVKAIQEYWLQSFDANGHAEGRTPAQAFAAHEPFAKAFKEATARYPGLTSPAKSTKSIGEQVRKIGKGESEVEYYKLRAFSDFIGLKPAGLLLLFTQLVGEERKAREKGDDARAVCSELLRRAQSVLDCAKQHVDNAAPSDRLFLREYEPDDASVALPDIKVLRAWAEAFKADTAN